MRVVAVIVGLIAMAFGGGCLMLVYPAIGVAGMLLGLLPLFAGGGLAGYALLRGGATPFPKGGRVAVWLVLLGLVAIVVLFFYVLATLNIH